jgi:hypothetical protein
MSHRVLIGTVAVNGTYPQLAARLIRSFAAISPGYEVKAWINCYPPDAPADMTEDGYDYSPYTAKPFVLAELQRAGADIGILLDASFHACRDILPLVEHIQTHGYFLCRNGFKVGEWISDRALKAMEVERGEAWEIDEASSYCVGVDFRADRAREMMGLWRNFARSKCVFPGHHTAGKIGRNPGFVSDDPRVRGHRHDQAALSIIAHWLNMRVLVDRPHLTAYAKGYGGAFPDETTVLVNDGSLG